MLYRTGLPRKGGPMASQEKYTILYGRLSQEDMQKTNRKDDSNSIQNQRLLRRTMALKIPGSFTMTATPEQTSTGRAGRSF